MLKRWVMWCALAASAWGAMPSHVEASLRAQGDFAPGRQTMVEIVLTHDKGWHTYGPAEVGATTIDWQLPTGWSAGEVQWPNQQNFKILGISSWGYSDTVRLQVPLVVAKGAKIGQEVTVVARLNWVMCGEGMCIPGQAELPLKITVGATGGTAVEQVVKKMMRLDLGLLAAAWLGGLLLNLMPCVFPVLGVKILSFVKQAGEGNRRAVVVQAVAYACGIVASACLLGVAILALREGGQAIGWGFQLQDPKVVWVMAAVLGLLAMNMAGGWELPALGTGAVARLGQARGWWGAFLSGALMVAVATPCSAPFLGVAVGGVFVMPAWEAMAVMAALGLGMAMPYVLLAVWPSWVTRLPKPGVWMEDLKKILAWVMAAAALYMAWTYVGQVSAQKSLVGLLGMLILLSGVWACCHWKKWGRALGLVLLALGVWMGLGGHAALDWEPWSAQKVAQLRAQGRTVVVDFTARWCVNCLVNEQVVWGDERVRAVVKEKNIALLKADWTQRDETIAEELRRYDRVAVPLLVIWKDKPEPIVLPNLLSAEEVLRALE